jgi:hypothetical protein
MQNYAAGACDKRRRKDYYEQGYEKTQDAGHKKDTGSEAGYRVRRRTKDMK